jgi:ribosome-associated heat shock protein Hsp15
MIAPSTASEPIVRLDKWLWAARFCKTRALAAQSIDGGKVHVNGQRVKPSRHLAIGDHLTIRAGTEVFEIEVLALSNQRLPASAARLLYLESEESGRRREREREMRKLAAAGQSGLPPGAGRPSKRNRRKIIAFVRKGESHEKD